MRSPPQYRLGQRPDRDYGRVDRGGRRGRAGEAEVDEGLVDDDGGAGAAGGAQHGASFGVCYQGSGRVVEVGDQVREPGRVLPKRCLQGFDVPATGRQRHRQQPCGARADRVDRARVGGQLGEDPVPGAGQQPEQQVKRVQGAVGDQDLAGVGRHAAGGEPRGDRPRAAAARQPGRSRCRRSAAAGARPPRRRHRRSPSAGPGGVAQVRSMRIGRSRWRRPARDGARCPGAGRDGGEAARAGAAGQVAVGAQGAVRGGHRRPAQAERRGQVPLGRHRAPTAIRPSRTSELSASASAA